MKKQQLFPQEITTVQQGEKRQKLFGAAGLDVWTTIVTPDNLAAAGKGVKDVQDSLFGGIASIISASRNKDQHITNTNTYTYQSDVNTNLTTSQSSRKVWIWGSVGVAAVAAVVIALIVIKRKE